MALDDDVITDPVAVWGTVDSSGCQDMFCEPEEFFPQTKVGETIKIPCQGKRFGGSMTRTCNEQRGNKNKFDVKAVWSETTDGCFQLECEEDGIWKATRSGRN
eukprot:TRINITY_DN3046_c0_g1_i1.p5 TRINITY_DN3046_c0_g1~~TRINITY_DN3046_c0_g1_i1.p5  ORF type:complete len:103 (+),score=29.46 TRINITY_DN3046_c0_g1_i1:265-573(+)